MGKILYSGLVSQIKGSIGGSTFQSNKYGFTVRNKPQPTRNRNGRTSYIRISMQTVAQHWRSLSDGERDSWEAVAPNWPAYDAFGGPIYLTGYSVFCRASFALVTLGQAIINTGSNPSTVSVLNSLTLTAAVTGSVMSLAFGVSPVAANNFILIKAAPPQSAGRKYNPSRMVTFYAQPAGTTTPIDVSAAYVSRFGAFPPQGSRVYIDVFMVNITNGTAGAIWSTEALVGA